MARRDEKGCLDAPSGCLSGGTSCLSGLSRPLLDSTSRTRAPAGSITVYDPSGKSEVVSTHPKEEEKDEGAEVLWTIRSSVAINFFLFIAKVYAFCASGSLAVLASLVDSTIDLLGQGVLMWTKQLASGGSHDDYPVGRQRLEPVGVMVCAVVMGMASIEVISTASRRLAKFWGCDDADVPVVNMDLATALLLVFIVVLKALLWYWCMRVLQRHPGDESVEAIAQDNQNDVLSNFVALCSAEVTQISPKLWMVDPWAGIAISLYIIYTWLSTGFEQVELIVGKRADPEFLLRIQTICQEHGDEEDTSMQLDQLCAYHFGPKYLVEIEMVMPEATTLRQSHDAGIRLQHKIEMLEDTERCFVHIDYNFREEDDHDKHVPVEKKVYGGSLADGPRTLPNFGGEAVASPDIPQRSPTAASQGP